MNIMHAALAAVLITTTAACTQEPVGAVYKGDNHYGKNNSYTHRTYSDSNPKFFSYNNTRSTQHYSEPVSTSSQATVESVTVAPLQPISVNDAPPVKGKSTRQTCCV